MHKGYRLGTHRSVSPEATLERIAPHLTTAGITRCAEVTGLDRLGIPVYCAIRPQGLTLQVANGKGFHDVDAQVSALMEAIEVHHAEHPPSKFRRSSLANLQLQGEQAICPTSLPDYRPDRYFTSDFIIDWVQGEELFSGEAFWLPASAVYLSWPALFTFSSNGLASGNHLVEATLHGLYEVLERDAISQLSVDGQLQIKKYCQVVDLNTLAAGPVRELHERLRVAGIGLVLLAVPSISPLHTFWAVLLDRDSFSCSSMVDIGYGTHLSPDVAASRAITEAAQSRLTSIHGAREDINPHVYVDNPVQRKLFSFFNGLVGDANWHHFQDSSSSDLEQDYQQLLQALSLAGYERVFRVDLTRPPFQIPVVKVLVPGTQMNSSLF